MPSPLRLLRVLLFPLFLVSAAASLLAAEPAALSDLDAAKALAAREHKQLVVEFSGRTWCPPCKALLAEVLPSAEFGAFVRDRVYVHLDYPVLRERTPEKLAANPALAKLVAQKDAHAVPGFPTVLLLDADGKEIGRVVGYGAGQGADAYLKQLTGGK